jgi:beta-barrel assembly-enhancing protease
MRAAAIVLSAVFLGSTALPAYAQLGALGKIKSGADKAADTKQKADKLKPMSEKEERSLGEQTSLSLRTRFGVVQDAKVTKYVTLVGTTLAQASERPSLDWKFIVLDTDAVNAFAAPGGFIHVTRGLLGFCKNEAELAGVIGHEITHVTAKHAVHFVEHSNQASVAADAAGEKGYTADVIAQLSDKLGHFLLDNQYDQGQEDQADEIGVQLANKLGYDPHGLQEVLKRLDARNSGRSDKNGWFSSHPATKDRIANVQKIIDKNKLKATATVAARYKDNVPYEAKSVTEIAMDTSGASGLASGDKKKDDGKSADDSSQKDDGSKKGHGLSSITGGNKQAQSNQQVASAGARGVGVPDRDAKGGSNPSLVNVKVTPAELSDFKNGIA